ncbi:Triokinase/FMN cyclase [Halotydeus destructor]|nr:Triokinase/FMN cyclase [Halotydeus destructor]
MKTKHFINDVEQSVSDNLLGLALCNSKVQFVSEIDAIIRKDYVENVIKKGKVALISGCGSGHEPLSCGFVGQNGLTVSVAGQIFASPSTGKILDAIRLVGSHPESAGVLVTIINYTGDRLNFGLACERAKLEGMKVDLFAFADDVAFYGGGRNAGRRGLAGAMLFNKLMGALAEEGLSLEELKQQAHAISGSIGTMSVSMSACSIPGAGMSFKIGDDEVEVGLGIHGESGVQRTKLMTSHDAAHLMIDNLLTREPLCSILKANDSEHARVGLLLNNLGGISNFEMNILAKDALEILKEKNLNVERIFVGSYCSSFSMPGVSISLISLNDRYTDLIDKTCEGSVWMNNQVHRLNGTPILKYPLELKRENIAAEQALPFDRGTFISALTQACEAIAANESYLNELDKDAGDGDTGSTMKMGADAILESKKLGHFEKGSFLHLAFICENSVGGTSGALYSLLFTAAHRTFQSVEHGSQPDIMALWLSALKTGIESISKYSLAQPGDRSMLDTLVAVERTLKDNLKSSLSETARRIITSAEDAAKDTVNMIPKVGRASYVNKDRVKSPDAGAMAVAIWVKAIMQLFE